MTKKKVGVNGMLDDGKGDTNCKQDTNGGVL